MGIANPQRVGARWRHLVWRERVSPPALERKSPARADLTEAMSTLLHYVHASLRQVASGTILKTGAQFLRYRRLERAVIDRYGLEIQAGPFQGMHHVPIIPNHALIPKLLGIYEQEIHPWIEQVVREGYDIIANVGSAEGYYAVGLARRLPGTKVYAFDTEAREQELCRELVARNDVADRVTVQGHCDAATLQRLIQGRTLVIVDIEGAEIEVLDLARTPALAEADVLVEIHDFDGTTRVGDTIKARFAATHELSVVQSVPRRAEDHPAVAFLPEADRLCAVMERVQPQDFFFLRSRKMARSGR
jgi:hypothetical protein